MIRTIQLIESCNKSTIVRLALISRLEEHRRIIKSVLRWHFLLLLTTAQTVGGEAIIDAIVTNTPVFLRTSTATSSLAGSLVLNNIHLNNVPVAVGVIGGQVLLPGGTTVIASWAQGNVYTGMNSQHSFVRGNIPAPMKAQSLLDSSGRIFGRVHPQ